MQAIFLKVLNMSLTASWAIAAVLLARLALRRAPKRYSYLLWAAPLARLLCPISIKSAFSLIPANPEPIPRDIALAPAPAVDFGIPAVNETVNPALQSLAPAPAASANPLQIWLAIGVLVWLLGIAALAVYSAVTLVRLKHRLGLSVLLEAGVYLTDSIPTPFVIGVFKPKIYLPSSLEGREREYILLHERTHIKRDDHIFKLLAFAALCVHWFNPLVWAAFLLSGRDMEASCDERVLRETHEDIRAQYSASLLSLAVGRRIIAGAPLAFGEGSAKSRIKNALSYKEPAFWVTVLCLVSVAATAVGLLCDPKSASAEEPTPDELLLQTGVEDLTAALYASETPNKNGDFAVATFELIHTETDLAGGRIRLFGWERVSYFEISHDERSVSLSGGSSVPCAVELEHAHAQQSAAPVITLQSGSYSLKDMTFPGDGSEYESSIRAFAVDFDGKEISGLAERLMDCDGKAEELAARHERRIEEYISKTYGGFTEQTGADGATAAITAISILWI